MTILLQRRLFTVEEYHSMAEAGILSEDDRVELLDGEIVQMAPIGSRHAACVDRLNTLFSAHFARFGLTGRGERVIVRVQSPIELGPRSEPEPDVTLLRGRRDFYAKAHPKPADVLLVVEVADSSLGVDRRVKLPLYAGAAISELWLVDLVESCIEVYRDPTPEGYQAVQRFHPGARLCPRAFAELQVAVDEVLSMGV